MLGYASVAWKSEELKYLGIRAQTKVSTHKSGMSEVSRMSDTREWGAERQV